MTVRPAIVVSVAVFCLLAAGCSQRSTPAPAAGPPQRIVSLAPSITEMIFALGLGDRVVGVTKFCSYPPAATELPKVGGQVDPNAEAIALLRPDLVVLYDYQDAVRKQVEALGLRTLVVPGKTLDNVLGLADRLGEVCACPKAAQKFRTQFEGRIEAIRARTKSIKDRPSVLISVDRVLGGGLHNVYAAGDDGYFTVLLDIAGGRNACAGTGIAFPMLSPESIVELNPDVIVDLCVGAVDQGISEEKLKEDWASLKTVHAVQSGRVYVLTKSFATVPGPRSIEFLETLAGFLHPSLAGDEP